MEAERKRRLRAKLTQQERQEINKKRRETRPKISQREKQLVNKKKKRRLSLFFIFFEHIINTKNAKFGTFFIRHIYKKDCGIAWN